MKNLFKIRHIVIMLGIISGGYENICSQSVVIDSALIHPFGKVPLYNTGSRDYKNLIIMISGDGGWKYGVTEFAKEFAKTNSVVAGVDILRYYKYLKQLNTDCYHVFSDFVELATAIERKYNFQKYNPPVIMGYSSGATLVYGILAQARPGTFTGGISLGFCPDFDLPKMLCQTNGLEEKVLKENKSYVFLPDPKLGNPWIVLHGKIDSVCDFQTVSDFVQKTGNARLIALPKVGHGFSKWSNFMPQWKTAYASLLKNYDSVQISNIKDAGLSRIPFNITREQANSDSKMIALFLSGDGGWYGFEQSISNRLGNLGISVLGLDTKKYFWSRKRPEETAADVHDLLSFYGNEWNKSEFMLIGYSQGAEIIPFIYNLLPDDIKLKVKSLIMLSPEATTDFEVHVSNMIGLGNKQNTYDVIAAIREKKDCRQILIFGEDENTKVPELLKGANTEIIKIPGSHRYKNDTSLIVSKMKENGAF